MSPVVETISSGLINTTSKWLQTSWEALKRNPGLPYETAAKCQLKVLQEADRIDQFPLVKTCRFNQALYDGNIAMCDGKVWGDDSTRHRAGSIYSLPHDMKLNIIALTLAAMVPYKGEYKTQASKDQITNEISRALEESWYRFNSFNTVGLAWYSAAAAAFQGFKNTGLKVSDFTELKNFLKLCGEIHREMFNGKIWGEDNSKYNVVFDALPQHMKENYVLIALATLAALSGKEAEKPKEEPKAEEPKEEVKQS